jgi:hypothetical protein
MYLWPELLLLSPGLLLKPPLFEKQFVNVEGEDTDQAIRQKDLLKTQRSPAIDGFTIAATSFLRIENSGFANSPFILPVVERVCVAFF